MLVAYRRPARAHARTHALDADNRKAWRTWHQDNNLIKAAFTRRLGGDIQFKPRRLAGRSPFARLPSVPATPRNGAVVAFGIVAERAAAAMSKGEVVYCEDNLRLECWMGKDGQERVGLSVVASTLSPCRIGRNMPERESVAGNDFHGDDIPW